MFTDPYNNSVQQEDNYYVGLIFWNVTQSIFSRITSYKYIGDDDNTPPTYSLALVSIDEPISLDFEDNFIITDDSDLSRPKYPLLFVPQGKFQDNAYLNYILYCENNNDYRNINPKFTQTAKSNLENKDSKTGVLTSSLQIFNYSFS